MICPPGIGPPEQVEMLEELLQYDVEMHQLDLPGLLKAIFDNAKMIGLKVTNEIFEAMLALYLDVVSPTDKPNWAKEGF